MQLGNKIQHSMVYLGTKTKSGNPLGNKIGYQNPRQVLQLPNHNSVMKASPIEKRYLSANH